MRIISGKCKGRHIVPPKNFTIRPTTDFAKEGLFNILNNKICFEDIEVLDLFSGTGSLSYEFSSRGASSVVSVEVNSKHCSFIRETANSLKLNISVVQMNAFLYLKKSKHQFDLIFCDPPYKLEGIAQIPDLIFENDFLLDEGLFVFEHSSHYDFTENPHFIELRKYGSVHFSFFQKQNISDSILNGK